MKLVIKIERFFKVFNSGVEMTVLIVVPTLIGIKLDKHFGTKMIFTLILAILGSAVAFYELYRIGADKK